MECLPCQQHMQARGDAELPTIPNVCSSFFDTIFHALCSYWMLSHDALVDIRSRTDHCDKGTVSARLEVLTQDELAATPSGHPSQHLESLHHVP